MRIIFFLCFGFFALTSCHSVGDQERQNAAPSTDDLPDDFKVFYQQFHSDSIYQMEHIVFPLEGLPDRADSLTIAKGDFRWSKEEWRMQKAVDFDLSDYKRRIVPVNDVMIVEYILHNSGQLGMERRFAKFGDQWNLIYYSGINKFSIQRME